jgi:anti-sigma factor RsiW
MSDPDRDDRLLLLHAALDGELDAAGVIDMERKLAADADLAAEYARLAALRRAIGAHAPREQAPASLRMRALSIIADETPPIVRIETAKKNWRQPPSWRGFATAMAATAVVTLGLQHLVATIVAPDAATQAIVSAHMRSQISGQPIDVASSDRHTVKPWLASKLPVSAVVVDLAGEGFPLLGGRIDIVAGAAAPTLVYKRREHLISVTELRRNIGDYPATPQRRTLDGYPVLRWSDGERAYEVVSDLAPAELDAFVAAFRQAAAKETGAEQK